MDVYLYNWGGSPNVLNKTLAVDPPKLSGTLREECSVENPEITIQTDPRGYNYVYIPEFSRYYFITDIVAVRENVFRVSMHVDVLMSHSSGISALPVWCKRSAVLQSKYMYDNAAPITQQKTVSAQPLDCIGAHSTDLLLVTVG